MGAVTRNSKQSVKICVLFISRYIWTKASHHKDKYGRKI